MQLTFVLDCSNPMLHYVAHLKKEALKLIDRKIEMEIGFVTYRPNGPQNATELKAYSLKPIESFNFNSIPSSRNPTPLDKKSLQPIDVHRALNKALLFRWDASANRRILILIGKNPPHGIQNHELGEDADPYPQGHNYPTNNDILRVIAREQIHLHIFNIEDDLKHFCHELMGDKYKPSIAEKWVRCTLIQNEKDLTLKLLDCIVGDQDDSKTDEHQIKSAHETTKHNNENSLTQMRWIMSPTKRNTWHPVLMVSANQVTARIWNGVSTKEIMLIDLYRRLDNIITDDDIDMEHLLKCSLLMHQTLTKQRQESQTAEEMIYGEIKAHDNIKWMKKHIYGKYKPVLVLQNDEARCQCTNHRIHAVDHTECFVLDTNNRIHAVDRTALLDRPPYKTAVDIVNYVRQFDILCANYPWKRAIKCGTTQCSFLHRGSIFDTKQTGTIMSIITANSHHNYIRYCVQRQDNQKTQLVWSYEPEFQIVDADIDDIKKKSKALQKQNHQLTSDVKTLHAEISSLQSENHQLRRKHKLKELQRTNEKLKSEKHSLEDTNRQLTWDMKQLREETNTFKAKANSLQMDKDHLQSRVTKSKENMDLQSQTMNGLTMECRKASARSEEFENKFNAIFNRFNHLKQESDRLKKENEEQYQLVVALREEKIEDSAALDLSRGFPPVQDIVNDFGMLKSHYHVEASKQMKKVLKQRNTEYSKLKNYKFVCQMLFDILMKAYTAMKAFENEQYHNFAAVYNRVDIDNEKQKKRMERIVRESYSKLIDKSKKDIARAILDDIKAQYGMNDYFQDDSKLLEYVEQCIATCWLIVLARDPMLGIEPRKFDQTNEGTDFDEQFYIEGFGSEDNEPLNFVVWPSIVRQDTEDNISKITGVFIKEIPQWSKKKMKRMKTKEQTGHMDSEEFNDLLSLVE
eukprot:904797_1